MMTPALAAAREHAASMPLDQLDPATVQYFADGVELPYFERLRRDDPVHHAVAELRARQASLQRSGYPSQYFDTPKSPQTKSP